MVVQSRPLRTSDIGVHYNSPARENPSAEDAKKRNTFPSNLEGKNPSVALLEGYQARVKKINDILAGKPLLRSSPLKTDGIMTGGSSSSSSSVATNLPPNQSSNPSSFIPNVRSIGNNTASIGKITPVDGIPENLSGDGNHLNISGHGRSDGITPHIRGAGDSTRKRAEFSFHLAKAQRMNHQDFGTKVLLHKLLKPDSFDQISRGPNMITVRTPFGTGGLETKLYTKLYNVSLKEDLQRREVGLQKVVVDHESEVLVISEEIKKRMQEGERLAEELERLQNMEKELRNKPTIADDPIAPTTSAGQSDSDLATKERQLKELMEQETRITAELRRGGVEQRKKKPATVEKADYEYQANHVVEIDKLERDKLLLEQIRCNALAKIERLQVDRKTSMEDVKVEIERNATSSCSSRNSGAVISLGAELELHLPVSSPRSSLNSKNKSGQQNGAEKDGRTGQNNEGKNGSPTFSIGTNDDVNDGKVANGKRSPGTATLNNFNNSSFNGSLMMKTRILNVLKEKGLTSNQPHIPIADLIDEATKHGDLPRLVTEIYSRVNRQEVPG